MNPRLEWEGAICSNCKTGVAHKIEKGRRLLKDKDLCPVCETRSMVVTDNPSTIANIALAQLARS